MRRAQEGLEGQAEAARLAEDGLQARVAQLERQLKQVEERGKTRGAQLKKEKLRREDAEAELEDLREAGGDSAARCNQVCCVRTSCLRTAVNV